MGAREREKRIGRGDRRGRGEDEERERENAHALYVNYSTDNGNMTDECELEIYDGFSVHEINKREHCFISRFI